eukprot:m51a1_g5043 putative zinc finger mynd domain-containing protein 10-like (515) ;mRNA; r:13563-24536
MDMDEGHECVARIDVEQVVGSLQPRGVRHVGSATWVRQHSVLNRLNVQAHKNAASGCDEYIVEALVSLEKMGVLVNELVATELWRDNVLPRVIKRCSPNSQSLMTCSIALYHESVVVNLLEVCLYSRDACVALGEASADLAAYCVRCLARATTTAGSRSTASDARPEAERAAEEHLASVRQHAEFGCSVGSLSILRYLTDHASLLPLSFLDSLLDDNAVMDDTIEYVALPWFAAPDSVIGVKTGCLARTICWQVVTTEYEGRQAALMSDSAKQAADRAAWQPVVDDYYELLASRDELEAAELIVYSAFWQAEYFVSSGQHSGGRGPDSSTSQQRDALPDHDWELTEEELESCATLATLRGPQSLLVGAGDAPPRAEDGGDGYASDTEDGVGGDDDNGCWDGGDDMGGDGDEDGDDEGDDGDEGDEEERPLKRARWSEDEETQQEEEEEEEEAEAEEEEEEQQQQEPRPVRRVEAHNEQAGPDYHDDSSDFPSTTPDPTDNSASDHDDDSSCSLS